MFSLFGKSRDGNVVEDWYLTGLNGGEAMVGLPGKEPFVFKFDLYREKGK